MRYNLWLISTPALSRHTDCYLGNKNNQRSVQFAFGNAVGTQMKHAADAISAKWCKNHQRATLGPIWATFDSVAFSHH